jgi:hypothetical protein
MCLTVLNGERKRTAANDIQVYKMLKPGGQAPYQSSFTYKLHELHEQRNGIIASYGEVNEGFHAYTSLAKARGVASGRYNQEQVVVAIVPKGAHYYLGNNFEIVSDQLVIISLDNVA